MPATQILFYQDEKGHAPVVRWLREIRKRDRHGYANCVARIERLAAQGYELRRPAADFLRDGIYELRAKHRRTQYRILYFFHGRNVVVLSHAMIKSDAAVPPPDLQKALLRKQMFEADANTHTYTGDVDYD